MNLFESCTPVIHKSLISSRKPTQVNFANKKLNIVKIDDKYFAFPHRCPHRGTDLKWSKIEKDLVVCPYHGWQMSSSGVVTQNDGQVSSCKIKPVELIEAYDLLWMNKNNHAIPVKAPENMTFCGSKSFDLSAPFHVVLDNFNEGLTHAICSSIPRNQGQNN